MASSCLIITSVLKLYGIWFVCDAWNTNTPIYKKIELIERLATPMCVHNTLVFFSLLIVLRSSNISEWVFFKSFLDLVLKKCLSKCEIKCSIDREDYGDLPCINCYALIKSIERSEYSYTGLADFFQEKVLKYVHAQFDFSRFDL